MMSGSGDNSGQQNARNAVQDSGQPKGQPQRQPAGQAPPAAQASAVDKLKDPLVQDFAKGIGALYAIVGAGLGLLVIALGFVGKPALLTESQAEVAEEIPEYGELVAQYVLNEIAYAVITLLPVLAVAGAVFVGLYAVRSINADDQTTYIASGSGAFVGSGLMVILGSYLAGTQIETLESLSESVSEAVAEMDDSPDLVNGQFIGGTGFSRSPDGYAVQTVDLVVNAIAVGVVAAIVAVGTAYVYQNYLIDTL